MDHFIPQINEIAVKNGFKDFKLSFETGSDLGFIGLLNRCRIVENDKELSLFCKFLPDDDERNSKFNSYLLFEREVLVYKELFPIFEKFQKDHGIDEKDVDGFWHYPKCYYCNHDKNCPSSSVIIMEDLTIEKFEVKDKFIPSDFNHTSRLFVELAKFHGLSLAINQKCPQILDKFKSLKNLLCFTMQTELMKDIAPRNFQLIKKLFENNDEIVEKLLPYKDNLWNKIADRLDKASQQSSRVMCHGDVWINNILYNYSDANKEIIKDIKLVDWQIVHCGSVGSELAYYLFCCVDYRVRKDRLEELLHLYHDTMRKYLEKFSLNIQEIFTYEALKEQIKSYGVYAFGMANFAIPLLCKYPEKLFENEDIELTDEEKKCVENYNLQMKHIVLEMIDLGIL